MMANRSDRRTATPITSQVEHETADRMGAVCAHCHQGWSSNAYSQAGYRRAVRPERAIVSIDLAPPGASI
jgi:hypothetical protein